MTNPAVPEWTKELISRGILGEIWLALKVSKSIGVSVILTLWFCSSFLFLYWTTVDKNDLVVINQYTEQLDGVLSNALTFFTTILGFLLAGFTIFTAVVDRSTAAALGGQKHPNHQISNLHYILLIFLAAILRIAAFLLLSVIIEVCLMPLLNTDYSVVVNSSRFIFVNQVLVLCLLYSTVSACMISTSIRLLHFIWHLYTVSTLAFAMREVNQYILERKNKNNLANK